MTTNIENKTVLCYLDENLNSNSYSESEKIFLKNNINWKKINVLKRSHRENEEGSSCSSSNGIIIEKANGNNNCSDKSNYDNVTVGYQSLQILEPLNLKEISNLEHTNSEDTFVLSKRKYSHLSEEYEKKKKKMSSPELFAEDDDVMSIESINKEGFKNKYNFEFVENYKNFYLNNCSTADGLVRAGGKVFHEEDTQVKVQVGKNDNCRDGDGYGAHSPIAPGKADLRGYENGSYKIGDVNGIDKIYDTCFEDVKSSFILTRNMKKCYKNFIENEKKKKNEQEFKSGDFMDNEYINRPEENILICTNGTSLNNLPEEKEEEEEEELINNTPKNYPTLETNSLKGVLDMHNTKDKQIEEGNNKLNKNENDEMQGSQLGNDCNYLFNGEQNSNFLTYAKMSSANNSNFDDAFWGAKMQLINEQRNSIELEKDIQFYTPFHTADKRNIIDVLKIGENKEAEKELKEAEKGLKEAEIGMNEIETGMNEIETGMNEVEKGMNEVEKGINEEVGSQSNKVISTKGEKTNMKPCKKNDKLVSNEKLKIKEEKCVEREEDLETLDSDKENQNFLKNVDNFENVSINVNQMKQENFQECNNASIEENNFSFVHKKKPTIEDHGMSAKTKDGGKRLHSNNELLDTIHKPIATGSEEIGKVMQAGRKETLIHINSLVKMEIQKNRNEQSVPVTMPIVKQEYSDSDIRKEERLDDINVSKIDKMKEKYDTIRTKKEIEESPACIRMKSEDVDKRDDEKEQYEGKEQQGELKGSAQGMADSIEKNISQSENENNCSKRVSENMNGNSSGKTSENSQSKRRNVFYENVSNKISRIFFFSSQKANNNESGGNSESDEEKENKNQKNDCADTNEEVESNEPNGTNGANEGDEPNETNDVNEEDTEEPRDSKNQLQEKDQGVELRKMVQFKDQSGGDIDDASFENNNPRNEKLDESNDNSHIYQNRNNDDIGDGHIKSKTKKTGKSVGTRKTDGKKLITVKKEPMNGNSLPEIETRTCNICNSIFANSKLMQRHIMSVHSDERPYECDICLKRYKRADHLKLHRIKHDINKQGKKYQCSICQLFFTTTRQLNNCKLKHMQCYKDKCASTMSGIENEGEDIQSNAQMFDNGEMECSAPYKSDNNNNNKEEDEEEKDELTNSKKGESNTNDTNNCKDNTTSSKIRKNSEEDAAGEDQTCSNENYICNEESVPEQVNNELVITQQSEDYTRPNETHRNKKGLSVKKEYDKPNNISVEIRTCNVCNMVFANKKLMKRHLMSVHSESRPYKCQICTKTYKRSDHLKKHILTHKDNKERVKYTCSICQISYDTPKELRTHKIRHSTCPYENCSYSYSTISKMKYHLNKHRCNRFYSCPVCTKKFLIYKEFIQHKRTCFKKKYICLQCNKIYLHANGYNKHVRKVHLNIIQNYKCTLSNCSKEFSSEFSLKEHIINFHHRVKRFFCSKCNMSFGYRSSFRRHNINIHP
ncbi:zinc finger transcription factor [Plasmodium gonderi]|uniref:Zinc finger transcription factor n=1 Tax=Plasmodium gonderi TaxID=77519 RepID=A0A1Y1JJX4_PLAGO|nr:zinc finger transcription factor [Plasmodium gonderi]GAW82826.1 zinc finger transcription factor [Plasmodium gonderi]